MTIKNKQTGISLLEQLLAISIIALIVMLGLQRYLSYQRQTQIEKINADLETIFFALDDYFHNEGCNQYGKFIGKINPNLNIDLKLQQLINGRDPWIKNYTAHITKFSTRKTDNKPLYQLIITAETKQLNHEKMRTIINKTNGFQLKQDDQEIKWRTMPTHESKQPSEDWILAGHLRKFKNLNNQSSEFNNRFYCAQ